jgi:hypothetical protein
MKFFQQYKRETWTWFEDLPFLVFPNNQKDSQKKKKKKKKRVSMNNFWIRNIIE